MNILIGAFQFIVGVMIVSIGSETASILGSESWTQLHQSGYEGDLNTEWDQISAASGTFSVINEGSEISHSPNQASTKIAKAYQDGSNSPDGSFSRSIWHLSDWSEGVTTQVSAWYYLPSNFYDQMQGAVQLLGYDTYPTLQNQLRLAIYNFDKNAYVFVMENGQGRNILKGPHFPTGEWFKVTLENELSNTKGWSKLYVNDQLVASTDSQNCEWLDDCGDTMPSVPITRVRFGLVAIANGIQTNPLAVYLDNLQISTVQASSDNYYVSLSGNDSNSGTENAPFKTIQKAADIAQAGETVFIRGGTHYPTSRIEPANSGNEAEGYITFTAYPGEEPVVDGAQMGDMGWGGVFYVRGTQSSDTGKGYIKISNLKIINSKWFGIAANYANHVIIQDNEIYDTAASGIYSRESSYITIDGNDVQMAGTDGYKGNITDGCAGGAEVQEMVSVASVSHFEIKNNTVHNGAGFHCGGEGIDVKEASSYGSVHHNQVYDLPANFTYDGTDRGEVGIYVDSYDYADPYLHDIEVYNNIVSTPQGVAINAEQGGIVDGVKIYNNIIYDVYWNGLQIGDCCGSNEGWKKNIHIFNNVVYNSGHGTDWAGGIAMRATKIENIEIDNNILSQNNTWQLRDKSGQATMRNNIIDGDNGGFSAGVDFLEGDPGFVNASSKNFHLVQSSIAIDAGLDIAIDFDFDDRVRPVGTGIDIGPFESPEAVPPGPDSCKGDYNDDGTVDIADFGVFGQNYKQDSINCYYDLIGDDCYLGIGDFGQFAGVYKTGLCVP